MADAGQVTLRLSVRDQEVVRQALAQLGKDGEAAARRLDQAQAAPSRSASALSSVVGNLKDRVSGLAFSIGPLGTGLIALGPVGLVAGAALGGIAAGLEAVSGRVQGMREAASVTKEGAEQARLAVPQYAAFQAVLEKHGGSADEAAAGLTRLNVAHAQAVKGEGELYKVLQQINPALAEEFANAKAGAEAFDVFNRAHQNATANQQDLLERTGLGRAGSRFRTSLGEVFDAGGLDNVAEKLLKVKRIIDPGLTEALDEANKKSKERSIEVANNWDAAALAVASAWKRLNVAIRAAIPGSTDETFSQGVSRIARRASNFVFGEPKPQDVRPVVKPEEAANAGAAAKATAEYNAELERLEVLYRKAASRKDAAAQNESDDEYKRAAQAVRDLEGRIVALKASKKDAAEQPISSPSEKDAREKEIGVLTRWIKNEKERIALLGETAPMERRLFLLQEETRLERLQVAPRITADEAAQIDKLNEARLKAAEIAKRVQLGVPRQLDTGDERRAQFQAELNLLVKNGIITQEEYDRALALHNKTLKETIEQEQVRKSLTPALTQFSIDAKNSLKAVDQAAAQAFNSIGDAVADVSLRVKSAGDAIKSVVDSILRSLIKIGVNQLLGPIAGGAAKLFAPSALGNVFDRGLVPFAQGGVFDRPTGFRFANGGRFDDGILGEAGPEGVLPLRRNSRGQLGVIAGGAGGISVGDTHIHINGNVGPDEVDQIKRELAAHRKALIDQSHGIVSAQRFQRTGVY